MTLVPSAARLASLFILAVLAIPAAMAAEPGPQRKIVLIAGPKSHGPVGNGIHDYPWSVKLLKVMLDNSNVADRVKVEYHLDGWPKDPATLDDADTILVVSDGRDGNLYEESPPLQSPERVAEVQKQIDRGCGFATFHFSTFAPDKYAPQILDWSGAYFDWEENGERKWYSAIQTHETEVELPTPAHPVCRGVAPFRMKEEFYFNLRFGEATPLLSVPVLPGREGDGKYVAWARERPNKGRGFGTTCGHFYDNWRNDDFRKLILNALCWTAQVEVPAGGVEAKFYTHAEITTALSGVTGTKRAAVDDKPIRVLILAGNDAHKWHNWEKTTPVIQKQLEADPRIRVEMTQDPEAAFPTLQEKYDVLVQNSYANWHDKSPLSDKARTGLVSFLEQGGGLLIVHFGNGAWNFSLPMAAESDWPEYRKIVRRVWNHHGKGDSQSGHDAFGRFSVAPTSLAHEITRDLKPFELEDELYFRQDGTDPIEPLITASSKVTKRDEPLAWTYTYGKGRVFQTLLGHSEKTYAVYEPCEMLRRGVAWAAGRKVIEFDPQSTPPATDASTPQPQAAGEPKPAGKVLLTDGKFGKGLSSRSGGLFVDATKEMRDAPVTVECWARLNSKQGFNILLASEEKSSPSHWELYSYAGSGVFSVYMPGRGGEFRTGVDICDGAWHHVAMAFEPKRLRLFVDGRMALDKPLAERLAAEKGTIAIGSLVEGGIGCDGTIDDVRISRGARLIEKTPTEPLKPDDTTLGLWPLDVLENETSPDVGPHKRAASTKRPQAARGQTSVQASPPKPTPPNHWGKEAVGFDWTEQDSVDNRWQQTDIGPWLHYTVPLPEGPVRKGLSLKLGSGWTADGSATQASPRTVALYDTERMQLRGIWSGGFLRFDPARYGIIGMPRIDGVLQFSTREGPAWSIAGAASEPGQRNVVQYVGLSDVAEGPLLRFRIGTTPVSETVTAQGTANRPVVLRTITLEPHAEPFELTLFDGPGSQIASSRNGKIVRFRLDQRGRRIPMAVRSTAEIEPIVREAGAAVQIGVRIPAATERQTLKIACAPHPVADLVDPETAIPADLLEAAPVATAAPAPRRWGEGLATSGKLGQDQKGFALDTLPLPFNNPWKALLFTTGVGFFDQGGRAAATAHLPEAAICTVHGDVWTVSGVDAELKELRWRRYATGLYQPLGLTIVGTDVYVLGRDQITRLRDTDGNGEADEYQCVNNLYETSAGGHDYVACLERDPANNFYLAHATQGVLRASGDGKSVDVVAAGLRNPNGLGMGMIEGRPVLTAAPQEGEWTPGSAVYLVRPGEHYGYPGPRGFKGTVTPTLALEEPLSQLGVNAPLCWIPRRTDNSCGGQTWIDPGRWGSLGSHWLHHSFGQCTTMLVLQEGHFPDRQGATVPLPLTFDSGICRGRFRETDGHLYVVGLRGWVTSATQDGCLQRVRRTGTPSDLPIAWKAFRNGLEIRFARPLDRESAQDPGSYHVEAWNYRYSAAYGSADWKVSHEAEEGHDELPVMSATLLRPDTVFLEIEPLPPACQVTIQYSLQGERDAAGPPIRSTLAATLHKVPDLSVDPALLHRGRAPGQLTEAEVARLQPGILVHWKQGDRRDTERRRMAALFSAPGEPATPFLEPGPASATFEGLLKVPLRAEYGFRIEALPGSVTLEINGRPVTLSPTADGLSSAAATPVALHAGYNRVRLEVPASDRLNLRLFWSSAEFAEEPVPPTVLFCDSEDPELTRSDRMRRGRDLYLDRMCARCHAGLGSDSPNAPLESRELASSLKERRHQLRPGWLRQFVKGGGKPSEDNPHRRMPRLYDPSNATDDVDADFMADMLLSRVNGREPREASSPLGSAERGRVLYEDLGCIACHRLGAEEEGLTRRSLAHLGDKFLPEGLVAYLQSPHADDPWNRMPDFKLTAEEAADLAALLIPEPGDRPEDGWLDKLLKEPPNVPARMSPSEGWRYRGCSRCHDHESPADKRSNAPKRDSRPAISIRDVMRGCLAGLPTRPSEWGQIPDYGFSKDDRAALIAFLSADGEKSLGRDTAVDASRRLMARLDCQACHSRDSAVSPRGGLIALESDRGLAPETLPTLTWAGEKLHTDWVTGLLAGKHPQRPRPWLKARMPAFPAYADAISRGLAAEHGLAPGTAHAAPKSDPSLAGLGKRLIDKEALDCRQCHALGELPPTGDAKTLLAPGINFAMVPSRIQPEYYARFTLDPPRFDVTTRMPKLAIDGRTTKVKEILDGDARRQFAAIWALLIDER